jgi:hypothetical protein
MKSYGRNLTTFGFKEVRKKRENKMKGLEWAWMGGKG